MLWGGESVHNGQQLTQVGTETHIWGTPSEEGDARSSDSWEGKGSIPRDWGTWDVWTHWVLGEGEKGGRCLPGPALGSFSSSSSSWQPSCHTLHATYCQYCLERAPTAPKCFFTASYFALPHSPPSAPGPSSSSPGPCAVPRPPNSSSRQQTSPRGAGSLTRPMALGQRSPAGWEWSRSRLCWVSAGSRPPLNLPSCDLTSWLPAIGVMGGKLCGGVTATASCLSPVPRADSRRPLLHPSAGLDTDLARAVLPNLALFLKGGSRHPLVSCSAPNLDPVLSPGPAKPHREGRREAHLPAGLQSSP